MDPQQRKFLELSYDALEANEYISMRNEVKNGVLQEVLIIFIPRLIINSNMPKIVFEAELNGLMELIRKLKRA